MTRLIYLISLSSSTMQAQWKTLSLNEGSRWPLNPLVYVFFHEICLAASFPKNICDPHVISRKKEATEKSSAKYVLYMKYFHNVPTLSHFPYWYELIPCFSRQIRILKYFSNRNHLEISNNTAYKNEWYINYHIF